MKTIKKIFFEKDWLKGRFSKHEFQVYGYRLAESLGDLKNKSLYIKLAKEEDRDRLQTAWDFVKSAREVKSKPRLFMWKLTQLRREGETGLKGS